MIATVRSAQASSIGSIVTNLRTLVKGQEECFGISLPLPEFVDLLSIKQFCSGLLEPGTEHLWRPVIAGLPLKKRLSIAGTLFLFRKVLPASTPDLDDYLNRLSQSAPPPPPGYLRFISEEIGRLFPVGWDEKHYPKAVYGYAPSVSACLESPRSKGGSRGILRDDLGESRAAFCAALLDKYSSWSVSNRVRVQLALCDGKQRLVTVPSSSQQRLGPLHNALYDHISAFDWLLRGEAEPRRFVGFSRKSGESFVSGDYESATDNLNQEVARHILNQILVRCSSVPLWVRDAAMRVLSCTMVAKDRVVRQRRGQLMGNYVCFPLLCLQNYLAFKFLVPREGVPLRINGDDIVFRARPDEIARWKAGVLSTGLKLSPGKTSINDRWFSLNSTFFRSSSFGVRLVPVVRSTHLFKPVDGPGAISERINSVASGFGPVERGKWQLVLLREIRSHVFRLQRSVRRGLGCRVAEWVLRGARLWERECFYLSLPAEPQVPSLTVGYKQQIIPEGWRRVTRPTPGQLSEEREFFRLLVSRSWTEPFVDLKQEDMWRRARENTYECSHWLRLVSSPRMRRLLGRSVPARWVRARWPRVAVRDRRVVTGVKCWVRCDPVVEPIDGSSDRWWPVSTWDQPRYQSLLLG